LEKLSNAHALDAKILTKQIGLSKYLQQCLRENMSKSIEFHISHLETAPVSVSHDSRIGKMGNGCGKFSEGAIEMRIKLC